MMQLIPIFAFSGAAAAAGTTIYSSLAPQWRRILALAAGRSEASFAPLSELVLAERRIAVRRWGTARSSPAMWREAA